ncbi:MAG: hypothetical protein OEY09_05965 [Gammaproteobacteria bacterium]|nr:hypothetical protein [Gammaproteobacteria bacterium]
MTTDNDGWTHVRETVRMLFLAIAQIEIALRESDDSVEHLTDAFTSMVDSEMKIAASIDGLALSIDDKRDVSAIKRDAIQITEEMQSVIVAFQFYDKLTQRLAHVSSGMEALSGLLNDDTRVNEVDAWSLLQNEIKSKYSMREEHELFDVVMAGADVREAIRRYNDLHKDEPKNDIELF